ncbi:MAG: hypothetical protein AAB368_16500, partial [bacterium]
MRSKRGWFGSFGGQFAPETLMPALREVEKEFRRARRDPAFRRELGGAAEALCRPPDPRLRGASPGPPPVPRAR